jgi:hypothetical protein
MVRGAIERHIDQRELEVLMAAEQSERQILRMFAADARSGRHSQGGAA